MNADAPVLVTQLHVIVSQIAQPMIMRLVSVMLIQIQKHASAMTHGLLHVKLSATMLPILPLRHAFAISMRLVFVKEMEMIASHAFASIKLLKPMNANALIPQPILVEPIAELVAMEKTQRIASASLIALATTAIASILLLTLAQLIVVPVAMEKLQRIVSVLLIAPATIAVASTPLPNLVQPIVV